MDILLAILAFLLLLTGLLGAVLPVLPGPPLGYAGLLLLKWSGYGDMGVVFLVVWGVIAVAVTVVDYVLPAWTTKIFGGSRSAMFGSILGLIAGLFLFPPFGIILGPFLGAFIGELIHNSSNGLKALKVALGAFLAFLLGTGIKLVAGVMMIFYAVKSLF